MPVVKKSVAINSIIDISIRKVWARLIRMGYDASYSTAINVVLLSSVDRMTEETMETELKKNMNLLQKMAKEAS